MKKMVILLAILLVGVLIMPGCSTAATTTGAPTTTAATTSSVAATPTIAPTTTVAPTNTAAAAINITWEQASDPQYENKTVTMTGPCIGTYQAHDLSLVLGTLLPDAATLTGNVGPGCFLAGLSNAKTWPDLAALAKYVGKNVAITGLLAKNGFTGELELSIRDEKLIAILSGVVQVPTQIAPAATATAPVKTTAAAGSAPTITWEQARLPENINKTVRVTGPVVAIHPAFGSQLMITLGKEMPDGFDLHIFDPTKFPDPTFKSWIGKNVAATGKISVSQFKSSFGSLDFPINEASQIEIERLNWTPVDSNGNGTAEYYSLMDVVYCEKPVLPSQSMNIFVPAAYMNADGTINNSGSVGGYTAATAPIIYENGQSGYNEATAKGVKTAYTDEGFVYVSVGSRGRNSTGGFNKSPASIVDLKAGIRFLKYHGAEIPGDEGKIVSIGSSGGGAMSSLLGATGNLAMYDPYLKEIGAIMTATDDVYAAMCYCPIIDLDNADLAYAWWRQDSNDTGVATTGSSTPVTFSAFQLALQQDLASKFVEYVNSLNLGLSLGNDGRSGTYYTAILGAMSDGLNAYLDQKYTTTEGKLAYLVETYGVDSNADGKKETLPVWMSQNSGTFAVTDMAGFIAGTKLIRNKNIPGFDTLDMKAENNAFGTPDKLATHYSKLIAEVMKANYAKYAALAGCDTAVLDAYIADGADSTIMNQAYLYNAMRIVEDGASDVAPYWRLRNGTADQHTSFTVAFNLARTLEKYVDGVDVDYHLVWNMPHGFSEGTSTGTFTEWVKQICK